MRKRKLTLESMVWLLVCMAIYNNKSMKALVNQLDIVDRTGKAFVAPSALTQRRKTLGESAIKAVFTCMTTFFGKPYCLIKEASGGGFIPFFSQYEIDCVTVLIDSPIEVVPTAFDFDVGLVHSPRTRNSTLLAITERGFQLRGILQHPAMDSCMIHLNPALCQQLFNISVAKLISCIPANRHQDGGERELFVGEIQGHRGAQGQIKEQAYHL
jgi:hypothetical protein